MLKYVPLLIALIILLMFSAFFSCAETALSTSNIIRLKGYVEEKRRGAKKLYI
jgi:Mg2+/Co2+ transporter CorB